MEATVVKREVKGDFEITEMSDGRILYKPVKKARGTQYGDYVLIEGDATEEEISNAKKEIVEKACDLLRTIADEREDFYIINHFDGSTSVGFRLVLPTVEDNEN